MSPTPNQPFDDAIFERVLGLGNASVPNTPTRTASEVADDEHDLRVIRAALDSYQTKPASGALRERILPASTPRIMRSAPSFRLLCTAMLVWTLIVVFVGLVCTAGAIALAFVLLTGQY